MDAYLTPGVPSPDRQQFTDPTALEQFAHDPATVAAAKQLLSSLHDTIASQSASRTLTGEITPVNTPADFGNDLRIKYSDLYTYPGFLAGGLSGVESNAGASWDDSRDITGTYELDAKATEKGVLASVTLVGKSMTLDVKDSVDFCPGNLAGAVARQLTVDLSRLERTAYPNGQMAAVGEPSFAKPVLFEVKTGLDDQSLDVTDLFPSNDPDGDGIPDLEPWSGAQFPLDNCPGVYNPDQADSDNDGVGDACETPPSSTELRLIFKSSYSTSSSGLTYICNNWYPGGSESFAEEEELRADIPLSSVDGTGSGAIVYPTPPVLDAQASAPSGPTQSLFNTGNSPGTLQFNGLGTKILGLPGVEPAEYETGTGCGSTSGPVPVGRAVSNLRALVQSCGWTPISSSSGFFWVTTGWKITPVPAGKTGLYATTSCAGSNLPGDLSTPSFPGTASLTLEIWQGG